MVEIFVNLKRYDVPKNFGGICPELDPNKWIESIIGKTIEFGLGKSDEVHLTFLLPESLLMSAMKEVKRYPQLAQVNQLLWRLYNIPVAVNAAPTEEAGETYSIIET